VAARVRPNIASRRARDRVAKRAIEFSHDSVERAAIAAVSREQHHGLEALPSEAMRLLNRKRRQGRGAQRNRPR
jgi:hypothetical protein